MTSSQTAADERAIKLTHSAYAEKRAAVLQKIKADKRQAKPFELDIIRQGLNNEELSNLEARHPELRGLSGKSPVNSGGKASLMGEIATRGKTIDPHKYDKLEAEINASRRIAEKATIPARVTKPEPIYRPDGPYKFFADQMYSRNGDIAAQQRLNQHNAMELRVATVASGNFGAVVAPQHLRDILAQVPQRGRVTWAVATPVPLPAQGLNLHIPRGTATTNVEAQDPENTAVASTTYSTTDLVVPVQSYAGRLAVSWVALDRSVRSDAAVFEDLQRSYAAQLNDDSVTGDGTAGKHLGVLNTSNIHSVTSSETTFSYSFLRRQVNRASNLISGSLDGGLPESIILHQRRWLALSNEEDADGRPLVEEVTGPNGQVGRLGGFTIYADASIPTDEGTGEDEDVVIVAKSSDWFACDSGAKQFKFFLPRETEVDFGAAGELVAFGYSAFSAGRLPGATAVIRAPALGPPSF